MKLKPDELTELYEAVIKTSGHPDPLGYMARVLLFSEGDPDYVDAEGKQGFMPVHPDTALEEVGATEVQTLQGNVIATLAMDMNYFRDFGSVDDMIVTFHFGDEDVLNPPLTNEQQELLDSMPEAREVTKNIMYPPLATVKDIITTLEDNRKNDDLSAQRKVFFEFLLAGK